MLKNAGIGWLRGFYEWQTIQPKEGYWNWALPDRLVQNARQNGIRLTGGFAYFAPWASADGGTRRFPIKNIQYWRDYVSSLVTRYHEDIKHWEVWNEFNGSFSENGTPKMYAELVREAYVSAKKIDPSVNIGMSVANFDVGFLDTVIKEGAAGHFDYICVHPYEKLAGLTSDGELDFLNMGVTLRKMLARNGQPANIPLWITEIGVQAPVRPEPRAENLQAALIVKAYVLSIASGFERVFWFEARGPTYGKDTDHGLIRADMSPRPAYHALKTMTEILGSEPRSLGWLNLDGGYGFVFETENGPVLVAWSPVNSVIPIAFSSNVRLIQPDSTRSELTSGQTLQLTNTPLFITGLPSELLEKAAGNRSKPYLWRDNYADAKLVSARLGSVNIEKGVKQVNTDTTRPSEIDGASSRQTDFARKDGEGHYAYFSVDPQFAPFGTRDIEITAVVRRIAPGRAAGMSLNYESQSGYIDSHYLNISEDNRWQELKWKIRDANFVGGWGWNFRLNGIASPNEFLIKEVRVQKGP